MPSKKKLKAAAPWIDVNLYRFKSRPVVVGPEMESSLPDLFESIRPVSPVGEDKVRQIWIPAERGTIEDYGDFEEFREEGIVETRNEFEEHWHLEYPDPVKWYHSGQKAGAHPWEICRGGNSTHISLMLSAREKDWILSLAGSSVVRAAETTRMAAALYRNGIPFYLQDGKEILNMVRGKDYIGIVPDHVFPRYCHGLFPAKDRIIDFMNLPFEFRDQVIHHGNWYPPDEVQVH